MSSQLEIKTQINGSKVIASFSGPIDEDSDFSKIKDLKLESYEFNFDHVSMINSCGIREWINYLESLNPNAEIEYVNCPQIIIEQMNMVHGFVNEKVIVKTFYAPYYCEETDEEHKILLTCDEISDSKAPDKKDGNGNELEFDAIEEQYFNFLKRTKVK